MYKLLILLSGFFMVVAEKCDSSKNGAAMNCTEMGTVKDFRGMDGCAFLIVLDNGEKLQPVKYKDSDFSPVDGQRIKFGYTEVTDQVGICMAGKMVEVTCLELLESSSATTTPPGTGGIKPAKIPCIETIDPYSTEWMRLTLDKTNAYQVIRYVYRTDGFAYFFSGPKSKMMYDCQGTLICESSSRDMKCEDKAKNFSGEFVIWEKD